MPTQTRGTYAGRVYRRAFPSAKKSAALHEHSLAAEYNWRENGGPILKTLSNAQPWVVEAFLAVVKAQNDVRKLSRPKIEEREKLLDTEIMQAVAEMVRVTNTPSATAGQKIDADQELMELLAERQAIREEMEKRAGEKGH